MATPIGHLGDLTRRAEDVLKSVQIIAAEDTRRTRVLLEHIGHRAPEILSLHVHNEAEKSGGLVQRLLQGADIALVSDAGTPLINDPGYPLIQQAWQAGIQTVPVPGSSAVTALLSVCPLPCQPFIYIGFLPAKAKARRVELKQHLQHGAALVFLESPKRIRQTLADLQHTTRRIMLGRELTKRHESLYVGTAGEILAQLDDSPKGEMTVVIECGQGGGQNLEHERLLRVLLEEMSPSQAARLGANILRVKKSELYDLAVQLNRADI